MKKEHLIAIIILVLGFIFLTSLPIPMPGIAWNRTKTIVERDTTYIEKVIEIPIIVTEKELDTVILYPEPYYIRDTIEILRLASGTQIYSDTARKDSTEIIWSARVDSCRLTGIDFQWNLRYPVITETIKWQHRVLRIEPGIVWNGQQFGPSLAVQAVTKGGWGIGAGVGYTNEFFLQANMVIPIQFRKRK